MLRPRGAVLQNQWPGDEGSAPCQKLTGAPRRGSGCRPFLSSSRTAWYSDMCPARHGAFCVRRSAPSGGQGQISSETQERTRTLSWVRNVCGRGQASHHTQRPCWPTSLHPILHHEAPSGAQAAEATGTRRRESFCEDQQDREGAGPWPVGDG